VMPVVVVDIGLHIDGRPFFAIIGVKYLEESTGYECDSIKRRLLDPFY
jgi:hypothetical protein